jgi:adenylate cyclase class 2
MAQIEYAGKILWIDVPRVTDAITKAGATFLDDYIFRQYVFDAVPATRGTWVRLCTNGKKTTLTVKEITLNGVDGTTEWEVVMADFKAAFAMLQRAGLRAKRYQENRRIAFSLDGARLFIDYWPQLRPYLEIATRDKTAAEHIVDQLGFKRSQLIGDNTTKLYAKLGIDIEKIAQLTF